MWGDIIIGTGDKRCSASMCWNHKNPEWCHVSENDISYWISMPYLFSNKRMTIYKNTKEGNKITKLLASGENVKLNEFLFKIFISKIKYDVIAELIKNAYKKGVIEGKESKQVELLKVLGLR